jgi:hypothetical protein
MTNLLIDETFARLRAYRNNIHRYRRLLGTQLTDIERDYVHRRLAEAQREMDELSAETLPLALFGSPKHQHAEAKAASKSGLDRRRGWSKSVTCWRET